MVRSVWFLLLAAACSLLLLPSGCANGGSQTKQPPPPTSVLAYLHRSGIPNSYIIYDLKVLKSDGSVGTVLSQQNLISAVLSPDGQKILYSYYDPTTIGYKIATINPDGSGQTVLTPSGLFALYPQYTPDGSQIVYQPSGTGAGAIGVMNADGSDAHIVASAAGEEYCFPASNGTEIAVGQYGQGSQGLMTMAMDGSNQQFIDYTQYFVYPTFSADGSTIYFSTSGGQYENVYSIGANGSNLLQVTNSPLNWDPFVANGKIYFVSIPSSVKNPTTDSQQIFSMNPDGSNLTQVTNDTLYDGFITANGLCLAP